MPRLVADISRAKALLQFNPATSLEEGIRLMLERDKRFRQYTADSSTAP